MSTVSRSEAQQRADDIRVFRVELARLEQAGVLKLSAEQSLAVEQHQDALLADYAQEFDIDRDVQAKQLSLGMRVASFIGALALAASIFFLFYQFWGAFSETAQVAILVGASLLTLVATVLIREREGVGYFTKLAALVAFACFVLNIAMLGQIFNITPSDKALLPWAAFAMLLAYSCDLRLLLVAAILCLAAFIAARAGTWGGMYWLSFGERPENFFPAALVIFLIPQFFSQKRFYKFSETYRVFGMLLLFVPMLVVADYGGLSYLDLDRSVVQGFYQTLGFAGTAFSIWLGIRRHWPEVVNTGVTLFVIYLYTKFYDWWWAIMPKYLFFLVVSLVAIVLLFVFRRLRTMSARPPEASAS